MKSLKFDIIAAILVALVISACQKENHPPVIQSFTAEPDSVYPGDTISIYYSTWDEDMERMNRYLTAQQGDLFPHGISKPPIFPIHWIALEQPGDYYFHLRIDDGKDYVEDSISVHVKDTIGSFIDPKDGNEYKWVKIGEQRWMALFWYRWGKA
ncbi:MAG: hypothetical protein KAH17_09405 [Bacteroidales bacterium]|nr:hypothetical protein [Bacteroidales bacterium]